MAWTSSDLTLIEDAIRGAVAGKMVSFGGKTYTPQTIQDLWNLRDAIRAELDSLDETATPGISFTPVIRGW